MCFKKPKPPEKSKEDIAAEKELEEQLAARKRELAEDRRLDKEERTEEEIARAMGLFGMRSLIAGPKGGMGFGRPFRSVTPVASRRGGGGGGGTRPSAPPIMGDRAVSGYSSGSYSGGGSPNTRSTNRSLVQY